MKSIASLIAFIILSSVLSSLAISGLSYLMQKKHIVAEAKIRSSILLDSVNASSIFFEENQKSLFGELLRKNSRFYPELSNGFMLLRETADLLKKENDTLRLHLATLNPLHEENKADYYESRIIEDFNAHPNLKKKDGLLNKHGEILYFTSSPIKVTDDGCLNCHGKPENAPRSQIILYGMNNGYNWQQGKTVSAATVYVPLGKDFHDAQYRAVTIFFISLICFLFSFTVFFLLTDSKRIEQ